MSDSHDPQKIQEGAKGLFSSIQHALERGTGLLVGRNGTIELQTLLFFSQHQHIHAPFPPNLMNTLELHAGVFPASETSVGKWSIEYLQALQNCDCIAAGWYAPLKEEEAILLKIHNLHGKRMPLRSLEPYYVEPSIRWTNLLENQKVAIVNAFAETAFEQTQKAEEIWPGGMADSLFPPGITWIPVPTGYAPVLAQGRAEWPGSPATWEKAVENTVQRVVDSGARVALIGCGGLGMILGHKLKQKGVISIVLGGATQVLFGIKGGRWAAHPILGRFWNNAWVWPSESETPRGAKQIENGCYWNPGGKN